MSNSDTEICFSAFSNEFAQLNETANCLLLRVTPKRRTTRMVLLVVISDFARALVYIRGDMSARAQTQHVVSRVARRTHREEDP